MRKEIKKEEKPNFIITKKTKNPNLKRRKLKFIAKIWTIGKR